MQSCKMIPVYFPSFQSSESLRTTGYTLHLALRTFYFLNGTEFTFEIFTKFDFCTDESFFPEARLTVILRMNFYFPSLSLQTRVLTEMFPVQDGSLLRRCLPGIVCLSMCEYKNMFVRHVCLSVCLFAEMSVSCRDRPGLSTGQSVSVCDASCPEFPLTQSVCLRDSSLLWYVSHRRTLKMT